MRTGRGLTLIEVLLYAVLVGMTMTALVLLATTAFKVRSEIRAQIILDDEMRFASGRILSAVHEATGITAPAIGVTSSTLTLSMASSTQDPTTITLSGGIITLAQGTGTAVALTSSELNVSTLSFSRVSSTVAMVRLVMTGALRNATSEYGSLTVTTTAAVRR